LQNDILGLKYMFVIKNYKEFLLQNEVMGFKNTFLGSKTPN